MFFYMSRFLESWLQSKVKTQNHNPPSGNRATPLILYLSCSKLCNFKCDYLKLMLMKFPIFVKYNVSHITLFFKVLVIASNHNSNISITDVITFEPVVVRTDWNWNCCIAVLWHMLYYIYLPWPLFLISVCDSYFVI